MKTIEAKVPLEVSLERSEALRVDDRLMQKLLLDDL